MNSLRLALDHQTAMMRTMAWMIFGQLRLALNHQTAMMDHPSRPCF